VGVFLDGLGAYEPRLMHAIDDNATAEENSMLKKHRLAISRMCRLYDEWCIDAALFIAKKYHYILARYEFYKQRAEEFAKMPFTEDEQLYMATPEYSMTLEEYRVAHPEQFEEPKQGK